MVRASLEKPIYLGVVEVRTRQQEILLLPVGYLSDRNDRLAPQHFQSAFCSYTV